MSDANTGEAAPPPVDRAAVVDALRTAASARRGAAVDPGLVPAVRASAARLGIDPADLLTAMSYETNGTLNPNLWSGAHNRYLGLIQFGPEEQRKYGVKPGMSVPDQVNAAESFLRDRGVKPGMGLLDVYSTINAGAPGLYDRSDANNGGAPGTVYDKVTQQMAGHQARARALLAAQPDPNGPTSAVPNADASSYSAPSAPAPFSLSPMSPDELAAANPQAAPNDYGIPALSQAMLAQQPQGPDPVPLNPIQFPDPPGLARARMMNAMGNPRMQFAQRLIAAMAPPGQMQGSS